jgi:glucose dehydrogenase
VVEDRGRPGPDGGRRRFTDRRPRRGVSRHFIRCGGLPEKPTFRGSVEAIDARTGRILWKAYTVSRGYTGGAVWGSQPVIDRKRGLLYVGVGNNYSSPPGVCTDFQQQGVRRPHRMTTSMSSSASTYASARSVGHPHPEFRHLDGMRAQPGTR